MIDIEAEARAIVDGKGEAWERAEEKLTQAWNEGDQDLIAAWQGVFRRYPEMAYELALDDGFYGHNIWMCAGQYAAGLDPRELSLSEEEQAALAAAEAEYQAERAAGLHDHPSTRDSELDDDIPF